MALPETVAVVGAGTMGSGIGLSFALAGCEVRMTARRESSLDVARKRIVGGRVTFTTNLEDAVAGAGLVVETISEDLEAKRDVLARAEAVAPDDAVLATDTSSLSVDALAEVLQRPERFAGFHWFNPPELVELVEVVAGARTDRATVEALLGWAKALGKVAIECRDVPGFVVNRLQYALVREAWALVAAGVSTYAEIDAAIRASLGPRWAAIGPFETFDLAGLEVHLAVVEQLFPELDTSSEPPAALRELVAEGSLGVKSGRGIHGDYDDERAAALAERRQEVAAELARLRRRLTPGNEAVE
ncbi:MAG TPA: 3-hydroxyacyl-CoA dehydrogenase family protein [Gaiellaceae bacterium]|jgi:3-hydroxybutyryl-CoA dehydrogenase